MIIRDELPLVIIYSIYRARKINVATVLLSSSRAVVYLNKRYASTLEVYNEGLDS